MFEHVWKKGKYNWPLFVMSIIPLASALAYTKKCDQIIYVWKTIDNTHTYECIIYMLTLWPLSNSVPCQRAVMDLRYELGRGCGWQT